MVKFCSKPCKSHQKENCSNILFPLKYIPLPANYTILRCNLYIGPKVMCSERDILMCHVSGTVHMSKLCYVDTPGEWRIRIRHVSDTDTPWIRFQPYPKKMDTYWLRYVYPTRMGHVFERETMGRERRESERRQRGCA